MLDPRRLEVLIMITITLLIMFNIVKAEEKSREKYSIGTPTVLGNGCMNGDLSNYNAETSARSFSRKSCNFAVNIDVEDGYQVQISNFAYSGKTKVPPGSSTTFSAEHFFLDGDNNPSVSIKENYDQDSDNINLIKNEVITSRCGGSSNFRINTSLVAKRGNGSNEVAEIALTNDKFTYDISVKECKPED